MTTTAQIQAQIAALRAEAAAVRKVEKAAEAKAARAAARADKAESKRIAAEMFAAAKAAAVNEVTAMLAERGITLDEFRAELRAAAKSKETV